MILLKWGGRILLVAMLFYFTYNSIYGWNEEPIDDTERLLDSISGWLYFAGFFIYMMPIVTLYEDAVKRKHLRDEAYKDTSNGE